MLLARREQCSQAECQCGIAEPDWGGYDSLLLITHYIQYVATWMQIARAAVGMTYVVPHTRNSGLCGVMPHSALLPTLAIH